MQETYRITARRPRICIGEKVPVSACIAGGFSIDFALKLSLKKDDKVPTGAWWRKEAGALSLEDRASTVFVRKFVVLSQSSQQVKEMESFNK
jgi:hypothetical protein